MRQRSLMYQRHLQAWVEMMRAREAAEVSRTTSEDPRSTDEPSASSTRKADDSSALPSPDGLNPERPTPEDGREDHRLATAATGRSRARKSAAGLCRRGWKRHRLATAATECSRARKSVASGGKTKWSALSECGLGEGGQSSVGMPGAAGSGCRTWNGRAAPSFSLQGGFVELLSHFGPSLSRLEMNSSHLARTVYDDFWAGKRPKMKKLYKRRQNSTTSLSKAHGRSGPETWPRQGTGMKTLVLAADRRYTRMMTLERELHAEYTRYRTRRWFFKECGVGLAGIAATDLMTSRAAAAPTAVNPLMPKKSNYPAKAKRVIYLFMGGAPSHLELFDNKPELAKWDGKLPPADLLKGYRAAFINPNSKLMGSKYKFAKHGQSGTEMGELLPHTAKIVDDLTLVKSMKTDAFNHAPAQILMSTGAQIFGRPSFGAWTLYGLGTENQDLPGYVVLQSGQKGPSGGMSNFGCGFLPTVYQGVPFRSSGEPVLYLSNPKGVTDAMQRQTLDTLKQLNEERLGIVGDPEIASRINSFELAYRMQQTAPEIMDIGKEPQHILDMYGAKPGEASFANNCLLARRLIESGVRFVQLFHEAWDHHGGLTKGLKDQCGLTDQPCAALVRDLKQRGLLEDTIVIWGGEFGRTPMVQGGSDGRDHHPNAFTMWFAGGGMKPGLSLGATDEFGFNITEDPVHVHDLHATLLHLLGFEHTKLAVKFQGLDMRLTNVHGELVPKMLA